MLEKWRLLGLDVYNAYMNMAIDEAITQKRSQGVVPNTIRFYRWKPSAVSIGYFQLVEQEVNLDVCQELGVDVVRRMTGGGAVYHDYNGELTYSVIVDQGNPKIPEDITKSYETICNGIVIALNKIGINAEFKPINDIIVNGKKISGNAQTRRGNAILQHGTILLDADIRTMFKVLRVGIEKISDKAIKTVEERVTTINREMGRRVTFEEVANALKIGFEEALEIELLKNALTEEEMVLATRLQTEKYQSRDWTFSRPRASQPS
ncbi:lipoate--protein ligase family protein [Candidatus Bathyarchaeota archaeon]|nr:lipoate--protein ligase family protein [Candidatus Bathyarchaeota archaeon]